MWVTEAAVGPAAALTCRLILRQPLLAHLGQMCSHASSTSSAPDNGRRWRFTAFGPTIFCLFAIILSLLPAQRQRALPETPGR